MGGRGQGSEWPQGSALLAGGPMDQSRSIFHTHASGWPRIPGACCIQHWAPQSPGPTHSSDHFSPVRRLKGDGFCGCPDVAIPEKGASGPELLLWVNPSLSPKSPFSGPGPWPSAEWTCDQPLGGCPQREEQGEERAGHRSGPAGGSSLLPSLMCVRCPPSSVALVSTGYGTQGDAARPWFKCSEQRRSDSRAVSRAQQCRAANGHGALVNAFTPHLLPGHHPRDPLRGLEDARSPGASSAGVRVRF